MREAVAHDAAAVTVRFTVSLSPMVVVARPGARVIVFSPKEWPYIFVAGNCLRMFCLYGIPEELLHFRYDCGRHIGQADRWNRPFEVQIILEE